MEDSVPIVQPSPLAYASSPALGCISSHRDAYAVTLTVHVTRDRVLYLFRLAWIVPFLAIAYFLIQYLFRSRISSLDVITCGIIAVGGLLHPLSLVPKLFISRRFPTVFTASRAGLRIQSHAGTRVHDVHVPLKDFGSVFVTRQRVVNGLFPIRGVFMLDQVGQQHLLFTGTKLECEFFACETNLGLGVETWTLSPSPVRYLKVRPTPDGVVIDVRPRRLWLYAGLTAVTLALLGSALVSGLDYAEILSRDLRIEAWVLVPFVAFFGTLAAIGLFNNYARRTLITLRAGVLRIQELGFAPSTRADPIAVIAAIDFETSPLALAIRRIDGRTERYLGALPSHVLSYIHTAIQKALDHASGDQPTS
jgi:hypothetical protein